jgi:GNAT superfamily N-acetyltransferase
MNMIGCSGEFELTIEAEPTPDDIRSLEDSIYAFNVHATGISGGKLFGIFLRDDARVAVGGAFGWTWAGTCSVRVLFVPVHLRKKGHGTRVMRAVEAEALARGCRQILLETFNFQAPRFYLKLGFEERARISDYLRGYDMIVMEKHLDCPSQSALTAPFKKQAKWFWSMSKRLTSRSEPPSSRDWLPR